MPNIYAASKHDIYTDFRAASLRRTSMLSVMMWGLLTTFDCIRALLSIDDIASATKAFVLPVDSAFCLAHSCLFNTSNQYDCKLADIVACLRAFYLRGVNTTGLCRHAIHELQSIYRNTCQENINTRHILDATLRKYFKERRQDIASEILRAALFRTTFIRRICCDLRCITVEFSDFAAYTHTVAAAKASIATICIRCSDFMESWLLGMICDANGIGHSTSKGDGRSRTVTCWRGNRRCSSCRFDCTPTEKT
jgi:hypothetical protein